MKKTDLVHKPLLVLTLIAFSGVGGLMLLLTLFAAITAFWGSVNNLSYWNWISASATVVKAENTKQPATSSRSQTITSCPVIRFQDRTGKTYEDRSTCAETRPFRGQSHRPAYSRGQTVTVWYDPDNPTSNLIANHKPQVNPLFVLNSMTLLFGSMAAGFLLGAKLSMNELQKSSRA